MSKELRVCPGVGARKCGAFLARLDRDPHPTCTRCRGKVCTKDLTCDFCAVWSAEQWELFALRHLRYLFPPCCRRSCWTLTRTCPSFWRTRPCTGFSPCLFAVIGGTTAPPPPLSLGRTPSHQVLPPLPWRKPVRLRSVPFLCLPHRSPELQ